MRDAAHDDVAVAVLHGFEDHAPERVLELHLEARGLRDFLHEVDIKANDLFGRSLEFKRTVGRAGADGVNRGSDGRSSSEHRGGSGRSEQGTPLHERISFFWIRDPQAARPEYG